MFHEPNFERDRFEGQMNVSERKALYDLIIDTKPDHVFEVGTCRGGGSTYFISSALMNNEKGYLFTCEAFKEFYDYARALYEKDDLWKGLSGRIKFHFGDSLSLYPKTLEDIARERDSIILPRQFVDVCVLDGGEDSMQMVWDFAMFRPFIPVGGYLVCHDWDNGKSQYLKPLIMNDVDWEIQRIEIGLAIIKRVRNVHK